jgi:hypothetical protein
MEQHKPHKSSESTVKARVEEILGLILGGAEWRDLVLYAASTDEETGKEDWRIHARQLRNYVNRAYSLLNATVEKDRPKLFNRHLAQRRKLFAMACQTGDYSTALRVVDSEAKLLGLFPAERHEVTGKDGQPVKVEMNDDERRTAIGNILARYGFATGSLGSDSSHRNGDSEFNRPILDGPRFDFN